MDFQEMTENFPPFFSLMEEEDKPKKRLADPITTPRKGPLALSKSTTSYEQQAVNIRSTKLQHLPKQKWLNRLPVPNVQRPIDAIETNLGLLSFAELKQQAITSWNAPVHQPVLPTLNPLMKYTPVGHGNPVTESRTHTSSGPMDIMITYSRHVTPRKYHTTDWTVPARQSDPAHLITNYTSQARRRNTVARTTLSTRLDSRSSRTDEQYISTDQSPLSMEQQQQCNSSQSGQLISGLIRPTIAPHSLHAVAVHKFKPVTSQTIIKGHRLFPTPTR